MSENVFCDNHHSALYYSMHLLFERRLGWNLYCPIGLEWFEKGFWKIAEPYGNAPDTIDQFLGVPKDMARALMDKGTLSFRRESGTQPYTQNFISFRSFMETDFDIVIASIPNHEKPYSELAKMKGATFIRQMGNPGERCNFNLCRNILNSTSNPVPPDVKAVTYHPEFSLKDYCYTTPTDHNVIKNFMNCLPQSVDMPLWSMFKGILEDFTFKMHGASGEDGLLNHRDVPFAMRMASFLWNLKSQGDGYGFVVHQSYACGRPMIVKKRYYAGQLAEPLFEDSVTCIDLDLGSLNENIEKIRYFSQPDRHGVMCLNAYQRFKRLVNFDKEAIKIEAWLGSLQRR